MKIIAEYGSDDLAKVYVAQTRGEDPQRIVEFAESVQPPLSRNEKWVLIISTMFGCPVGCRMCDAGGDFAGVLTSEEMFAQIDALVDRRYADRRVPAAKFKIQFARMGEPALNPSVLRVIEDLPRAYDAPGLLVSLSTVAPARAHNFFEELARIKEVQYEAGRFQLQFSIHTTDTVMRRRLIPIETWSFEQMAAFGERFTNPKDGDRKVVLNFAPILGYPIDASVVSAHFNPAKFVIKLTPLNPTLRSSHEGLRSMIEPGSPGTWEPLVNDFKAEGYDVILSIGQTEENRIGSNCGQFVQRMSREPGQLRDGYSLEEYRIS
jgi:23S rRNA (adenine2503-C2)-methyltransferase